MNKVVLGVSCIMLCLTMSGCSWFKTNEKALSADGLALLGCVAAGAESGNAVESIAIMCGPMLVKDVVSILDEANITPVPSPGLKLARATTNPLPKPVVSK
jgi:hypothetical protein